MEKGFLRHYGKASQHWESKSQKEVFLKPVRRRKNEPHEYPPGRQKTMNQAIF